MRRRRTCRFQPFNILTSQCLVNRSDTKQEARLELERLVAEGKEDLSLGEITGAFPFPLDGFQLQAVESFLKGGCRNNGKTD